MIIGDWYRETSRAWFYALIAVIVGAIPFYMAMKLGFEQVLINSITPLQVNRQETTKLPLEVVENKIFALDNGTYSGYVRVKNPNGEWGAPAQSYTAEFVAANGSSLLNASGTTFVLPGSDKIIVFPRFASQTPPARLNFTLAQASLVRPPNLPTLDLEIQRRNMEMQGGQSTASAVIVNNTPFKISRVDLPVLLYDNAGQVVGANYTNINDLESAESRSFQYVWYSRINNVARIEIIPEVNIYDREIFQAAPSQNPF